MSSWFPGSSAHPSLARPRPAGDSARGRWDARVFGSDKPPPAPGSLAEILMSDGPLPDHQVLGVGVGIAWFLEVLNRAGHAHGDIRPGSVLLPGNDVLWLTPPSATLSPASVAVDLTALAVTLVECATGLGIDAAAEWTPEHLVEVGCSSTVAEAIGAIRPAAGPGAAAELLTRDDQSLPRRSSDFA